MAMNRTTFRDMHEAPQRVFLNNGGGACVLCLQIVPYVIYSQML
jgi:hypothetical protein